MGPGEAHHHEPDAVGRRIGLYRRAEYLLYRHMCILGISRPEMRAVAAVTRLSGEICSLDSRAGARASVLTCRCTARQRSSNGRLAHAQCGLRWATLPCKGSGVSRQFRTVEERLRTTRGESRRRKTQAKE